MDKLNLGYIGKRDSNSWYTPEKYILMAKEVLGDIDLDPFSSELANKLVQAERIYTEENSALRPGNSFRSRTLFMNPPYSNGLMSKSVEKFIEEYASGLIVEAIVLTNNATETKWFHELLSLHPSVCLVKNRISFISPDGKAVSGNTRGQVFFYFGYNRTKFMEVFSSIGHIANFGDHHVLPLRTVQIQT